MEIDKQKAEPQRVHRRRTKGWKMPDNTVYVGRGTIWGNPHSVEEHGRAKAVELYENDLLDNGTNLRELRGKNLACWCPLDQPCHADILLEYANE